MKDTPAQFAERTDAFRERRIVAIEDCGHMMHLDQPERLAQAVERFLTEP
jgi:pimeloyl-ACP methyl ester carboxylesterase